MHDVLCILYSYIYVYLKYVQINIHNLFLFSTYTRYKEPCMGLYIIFCNYIISFHQHNNTHIHLLGAYIYYATLRHSLLSTIENKSVNYINVKHSLTIFILHIYKENLIKILQCINVRINVNEGITHT